MKTTSQFYEAVLFLTAYMRIQAVSTFLEAAKRCYAENPFVPPPAYGDYAFTTKACYSLIAKTLCLYSGALPSEL